jgi:hypothetical protein
MVVARRVQLCHSLSMTTRTALAVLLLALSAAPPAPLAAAHDRGTTQLNHYETPCQTAARAAHDVPLLNDAAVAWELQHMGDVTARDFHAAWNACPPVALSDDWDKAGMVLVGLEYV